MRTQAQVLAQKFYYSNIVRRKLDAIRSRYGSNNDYYMVWYHRGNPIAIRVETRIGRYVKLETTKMTKPIAERFNALFIRFGWQHIINSAGRGRWWISDTTDGNIFNARIWPGSMTFRLEDPKLFPGKPTTIDQRMTQLYGKNWHSAA